MSGIKLFENEKGYAIDETDEKRIKVYEYTVGDYDGIKDSAIAETWINYETGLYQSWTPIRYEACYIDLYREKDVAIMEAKRLLKIKE